MTNEILIRHSEAEHRGGDTSAALHTSCCVVGGGPAGVVLALLLARSGVHVALLEGHKDFDRDFRGESNHARSVIIRPATRTSYGRCRGRRVG